mgnify:CR=1 FL=1
MNYLRHFSILFSSCLLVLLCCIEAHPIEPTPTTCPSSIPVNTDSTVTLIFAGDMMGYAGQYESAWNDSLKRYDYTPCFKFVKKYVSSADLACINLEVPLAGAPYSTYPQFCSPDELLDGLQDAGFDLVFTANNHVVDKGKKGLERTIDQLQLRHIPFAGSYKDTTQRDSLYPLIVDVKGLKIALLNCTYGTNGLKVHSPNCVNMVDTAQFAADIRKADEAGDYVKSPADYPILRQDSTDLMFFHEATLKRLHNMNLWQ